MGKGGYGTVYEAKNRLTKERVAIKLIDGSKISNFNTNIINIFILLEKAENVEMIFKEISAL